MKEKNWDFTFPDPFLKSMEKLNKIQLSASAMAMSDAWKAAVPSIKIDGAYTASSLRCFSDIRGVGIPCSVR